MEKIKKSKLLSAFLAFTMVLTLVKFPSVVAKAEGNNNEKVIFDFEDGEVGFTVTGGDGVGLTNVDSPTGDGKSLKVDYTGFSEIRITNNDDGTFVPGAVVTFDVYLPADQKVNLQPHIIPWDGSWVNSPTDKEKWVNVEFNISASATSIDQVGIQLFPSGAGYIFIDNVKIQYPKQEGEKPHNEKVVFDFEDGELHFEDFAEGDVTGNATLTNIVNPSGEGKVLKVEYATSDKVQIRVDNNGDFVPGAIVTMDIYLPEGQTVNMMPHVIPWNNTWVNSPENNKWVSAQLEIPSTMDEVQAFGVQFLPEGAGYVLIDNIKVKYQAVDKAKLNASVDEATKLLAIAEEGTEIGQYEVGSKTVLQAELDNAKEILVTDATTQKVVNDTTSALEAAINTFKAKKVAMVSTLELGLKGELLDGKINLTWKSSQGATSYKVLRSNYYGGPFTTLVAETTSTSFVDKAPMVGGNNVYTAAVVNAEGNVEYSEEINVRISGPYQQNDLLLFHEKVKGGWSGGQDLLLDDRGFYPVDEATVYNNLPSLHIKSEETSTQWMGGIAPHGWNAMNLEPYIANGTLEFNIKGAKGGEFFELVLGGKKTKGLGDGDLAAFNTATMFEITDKWQHVSIPLNKIVNQSGDFDLRSFRQVVIKEVGVDSPAMELWINDMRIVTPDNEVDQNPIKVNQVGYHTNASKYALVSGFAYKFDIPVGTEFQILNENNEVVYNGKLTLVSENDAVVSGDRILRAEFSAVTTPGTYYLNVDGVGKSQKFEIGDNIYTSLLLDATKYYYLQRGNAVIDAKYVGEEFARGEGLPQDANVTLLSKYGVDGSEKYDVSGGWYDAGDYGKYTNAGATAVSELLWSYAMFPEQFKDGIDFIPESGNGIPDLLGEVKWELDFLMRMQNKTEGGFYAHVWDQNFDATPDKATAMKRYIQDLDENGNANVMPTTHTADCVAALAQASIVYKQFDDEYSKQLLASATKGYKYLEAHPDLIKSFSGQPYGDDNDTNDRLWAAAEMFRATGEGKYNDYFLANYKQFADTFNLENNGHGWGSMQMVAYYAYASALNADTVAVDWFKNNFNTWANAVVRRANTNPWGHVLGEDNYTWGSNSTIADTLMDLYIGNKVLGNDLDDTIATIRSSINYFLGVNPLAFSFVSGYGENCLVNTYSNIYNFDKNELPPKGYFAGGPNQNEGADISKFNGRDYIDSGYEWTTNEHTIYWNSVLIFATAAVNTNTDVLDTSIFVNGVSLDKIEAALNINETLQLTATVTPNNATNKGVAWISSDDKIAKVDEFGKVTAIGEGRAEIIVKTIDGNFTSTCNITVKNNSAIAKPEEDNNTDKGSNTELPNTGMVTNSYVYVVFGIMLLTIGIVALRKKEKI